MTINLTKELFEEKISSFEEFKYKGDKPAVIDFYADWCGPCKMVSPIVDELAIEFSDKIDVYKVDTEEQQELAMMFGIQSIPSILFIPLEGDPKMAIGSIPKDSFLSAFKDIFNME